MGATQLMILDDGIRARLPESQRHRVAMLVRAVHHRPFVQAEAAELSGAGCGAAEHALDERGQLRLLCAESRRIRNDAAGRSPGGVPPPVAAFRRIGEFDTGPRMPSTQVRGLVRVVGEEEVPHRMLLRPRRPFTVRRGEGVGAFTMRLLAEGPVRAGDGHVSAGCRLRRADREDRRRPRRSPTGRHLRSAVRDRRVHRRARPRREADDGSRRRRRNRGTRP